MYGPMLASFIHPKNMEQLCSRQFNYCDEEFNYIVFTIEMDTGESDGDDGRELLTHRTRGVKPLVYSPHSWNSSQTFGRSQIPTILSPLYIVQS